MSGLVGRYEYLKELLQRYGSYETLEFVICCELGIPDCDELRSKERLEDESDPTEKN